MNEKHYSPREDTFHFLNFLEDVELEGKKILDMGTGSGVLAEKCLKKGAEKVFAVDINEVAVRKARDLLSDYGNVQIFSSNLFDNITEENFDIILFNIPYLPIDDAASEEIEKAWLGGEDGLAVLRDFLEDSRNYVSKDGHIFFLASDLIDLNDLKDLIEEKGYNYEIRSKKELFFETLLIYELWV